MNEYIPSVTAIVHEDFKYPPSRLPGKIMAANLGKPYNTLIQELEGTRPTHKFAADLLVPMMRQTGSHRPLDWICEAMDGVFVPLPKASPSIPSAQKQCLLAISKFGELVRAVGDSLLDGTITQTEREQIHNRAMKAVSAILGLDHQIEAECEE